MKKNKQSPSHVKFCWECSKKLWNTRLYTKMVIDGYERILHKSCAKSLGDGRFFNDSEEEE